MTSNRKGEDGRTAVPGAWHQLEASAPYSIEQKATLERTLPIHSAYGILTHTILCVSWIFYLGARFESCLRSGAETSSVRWDSWILLICETILATPELFQMMEVSFWFARTKSTTFRPSYRLSGDEAPVVHVFITTCGEDLQLIMDTVAAAALQDYPKHRYRVFVLDDANDPKLKKEIESFQTSQAKEAGIQPIVYISRTYKGDHPYKSGNLDHGFRISKEQYSSSEFIAGVDADMITEHDWLRRTVPHLILSPELAIVSPPQYFYDIPGSDILAQDANVLQQILEPVRDHVGCSMCHGSGYVMRREALESIGGWPLRNIGEDILCSYLFNRAGWQTAFIKDKLQFGTSPDSFHSYVAQRSRWTAGNILIAKKLRLFLPFLHTSRITKLQRLHGFIQSVKSWAWAALIVPLLVLPIYLLHHYVADGEYPLRSLPHQRSIKVGYMIVWFCTKLWKRIVFGHLGSQNIFNLSRNRLWITPYMIYAYCCTVLFDLEKSKFQVTGSFRSPLHERSAQHRAPLWKRLINPWILMHEIYALTTTGVLLVCLWSIKCTLFGASSSQVHPSTALIVRFFEIVVAAWVPVQYMVAPPTEFNRRECLVKDHLGAYRSSIKTWPKRESNVTLLKDLFELMIIVACDWLRRDASMRA